MKKMIKKLYSLYDTESQNFLNPLEFINHADAIRWFTTQVNGDKETNNVSRYPHQFALYFLFEYDNKTAEIGHYNTQKGQMEQKKQPKQLAVGSNLQEEQNTSYTIQDLVVMIEKNMNHRYEKVKMSDDEITQIKAVPTNGAGSNEPI